MSDNNANNGDTFSQAQLMQLKLLMREAIREESADAGLRIDGEHQDEAREDYRWLRKMRRAWDGAAANIGNAILFGAIALAGVIGSLGFWSWLSKGGPQ